MEIKDVQVDIKVSGNGIYCLGFSGADGKTYLYRTLKAISEYKRESNSILALTYDSMWTKQMITTKLKEHKWKYIILDRFDLYYSKEIITILKELQEDCVILIDLKNTKVLQYIPNSLAKVKWTQKRIEVVER